MRIFVSGTFDKNTIICMKLISINQSSNEEKNTANRSIDQVPEEQILGMDILNLIRIY